MSELQMHDIDIRIFGVQSRMPCIKKNKQILNVPDENIFIDEQHLGCVHTAKRAWMKTSDKPYIMVLQDDVELCEDFIAFCTKILRAHPDKIISLFPLQFVNPVAGSKLPTKSPYVLTNTLSGCGIIMKTEYVLPCVKSWPVDAVGDDTSIQSWAIKNNIPIITTLPSLIQHIGDVSVFDSSRSLGRTPYYNSHPAEANWDSDYITAWTNIIDE